MSKMRHLSFFICVIWTCCSWMVDCSVKFGLPENYTIEFVDLSVVHDAEHADNFVQVSNNWVIGDTGSDTYQGYKYVDTGEVVWKESYAHDSSHPAVDYGFAINQTLVSNVGSFPSVDSNQRVKSTTSSDYSTFYMNGDTLVAETFDDTMEWTGLPYGVTSSHFVGDGAIRYIYVSFPQSFAQY